MNPIKEFKKDWKLISVTIFSLVFVGFLLVGVWLATDPSQCQEKTPLKQHVCLTFTWGIRILIISLPIMVSVIVIQVFKEDSKDSLPKENKTEEAFDYSKLGANDKK